MTVDEIEKQRLAELLGGHTHTLAIPMGYGRAELGSREQVLQVSWCSDAGCSFNRAVNEKFDKLLETADGR